MDGGDTQYAARFLFIFFCMFFYGQLLGCVTLATTGAQMAYDHNNLQKKISDRYITMQAYRKIHLDTDRYKNTNVAITTLNKEVLLAGKISEASQGKEMEAIIKKIPSVKKVYNLTVVGRPSSPLINLSDTWITTKIKAKLIAANNIDPSQVSVMTENGTVYLMGILPPDQASVAVRIARTTTGVQNVVKIFSYLIVKSA